MYRPEVNQIEYLKEKLVVKGKLILFNKKEFPICVSKTEKIKENDWVYHKSRIQLFKVGGFGECNGSKAFNPLNAFELPSDRWKLVTDCYKVLAQSENFTKQMLESKFKNGEEVYLECEKNHVNHHGIYGVEFKIKHDKHNNVIAYSTPSTLEEEAQEYANNNYLEEVEKQIAKESYIAGYNKL